MIAVAATTLAGLHQALQERLVSAVAGFELETKTGRRAPSVIGGWLPPKQDADVEDFPFLIVRPRSGVDSQEGGDQSATAVVKIIVGTYSDTDDGWRDVLLLIDAIRNDLGSEPAIEGTAYEQVGPMTWEIEEQQSRPQWFGFINTIWQIPRPRRVEARNPMED